MSLVEIGVLLASAVVGWLVVSGVIGLVRQQRAPPVDLGQGPSQAASDSVRAKGPSLREVAETWHTVLQVGADASLDEIEAAYHRRIAECDGVRFSASAGALDRQEAERRRSSVDEAYNFIRTSRGR